ncbi:MAG: hypothetical protein HPZ91_17250 [Lentisphaeria bacterium]|nr:hypothetical protein [Lentisphaeria bacterium]
MAKKEIDKKALNAEISKVMMNDFERIGQGVIDYWKPLALVVVGIAVLVAAICWAAGHQKSSARRAQEALAEASSIGELTGALETYGTSPAAPATRYRLASLYIKDKKYDEALGQLKLASGSEDAYLNGNIALTGAYVLEQTGRLADAAAKFAALSGDAAFPAVMRAEARFAAARLYVKQKELAQAAGLLAQIPSSDVPQGAASSWDELSSALLRAIEAGEYGPYAAEPKAM